MTRIALNGARQLTLGEMIRALDAVPLTYESTTRGPVQKHVYFDFGRTFPDHLTSYRGSYAELAITFCHGNQQRPGREWHERPTAEACLMMLRRAMGATFPGWKGGDYTMGEVTPVWVAQWGEAGNTAVIGVRDVDYEIIIDTAWCEF